MQQTTLNISRKRSPNAAETNALRGDAMRSEVYCTCTHPSSSRNAANSKQSQTTYGRSRLVWPLKKTECEAANHFSLFRLPRLLFWCSVCGLVCCALCVQFQHKFGRGDAPAGYVSVMRYMACTCVESVRTFQRCKTRTLVQYYVACTEFCIFLLLEEPV